MMAVREASWRRTSLIVWVELLLALGLAAACTTASPPQADAPAPSGSWLAAAQRHIAEREYRASENGAGLQAPNRAHGLRTLFAPTGITVRDHVASAHLLGLAVSGVRRGAALASVAPGEVIRNGARVEIRRPGLVEWYENSPAGLEQGFTLATRPGGVGPLAIELALHGATAARRGDDLLFTSGQGRQLSYGKLWARDARGRPLPSRIELVSPTVLHLSVDDREASYPVVIDPLLTSPTPIPHTKIEGNESSARLGFSVAGAGDVDGDGYGDVIVGAPYFDAGQASEGAAFIFKGSASGIADGTPETAVTQLESDLEGANFGESVAGAGDVDGDGYGDVIVGAPRYGNGAAFVFLGSADGVAHGSPATAATELEVDPSEVSACDPGNAGFGEDVAGAGDVNGDGFDDVILGAPRYPPCSSISGILGIGAAFVFQGSASGIADATSLTAATRIEGTGHQGWLGASVSGAGDVNLDGFDDVIVGAPLYSAIESEGGAAFVFLGGALGIPNGTAATASARLESNQARAHLGSSVAGGFDIDHDGYADAVVGAPGYDRTPAVDSNEGAAFLFRGGAAGIANGSPETAARRLDGDQPGASLGWSVAGGLDTDRDGNDDIVAGAPLYNAGQEREGAVFTSGPWGFAVEDVIYSRIESNQAGAQLGATVAAAGDVNGDHRVDLIVGAPIYNTAQIDAGAALVYLLPEPGAMLSLAAGAAWLAALVRRRRA